MKHYFIKPGLLTALCLMFLFITNSYGKSGSERLTIPIGPDASILKISGNIEKLSWDSDGNLVWEAPIGDRVQIGFPMPEGARFKDWGLVKFDIMIEGGPVDVMIFIERPGQRRRVFRPIDPFLPPEGWQTLHLDLAQPEIVRKQHEDAGEPRIVFQLWSAKKGFPDEEPSRRISIRSLRLTKRHLAVRWNGVDYRIKPEPSGDLVYEYPIVVYNLDSRLRRILSRIERNVGRLSSSTIRPSEARLAPGDSTTFTAELRLKADNLSMLPALYCEWHLPVFSIKGLPDSDEGILRSSDCIQLPILIMPELDNPVVLFDRDGFQRMLERFRNTDWGKKEGDSVIASAEGILKEELKIPDGPGWASAFYWCQEHRCGLQYQGPGKHYCPIGKEFRDVDDNEGIDLDRVIRTLGHYKCTSWVQALGRAFVLTNDKRFSRAALEILNQYKDNFFTWQWMDLDGATDTIDKGRFMFAKYMEAYNCFYPMAIGYDLIKGAGGVTEEEARDIEQNFLLPGVVECTDYRLGVLARQAGITKTALAVGLACRHAPLIAFAVKGYQGYFSLRKWGATSEGIGHGHGYAQSWHSAQMLEMADMLLNVGINTFDNDLKRYIDGTFAWSISPNPTSLHYLFTRAAPHYPDPLYRKYARRSLWTDEIPSSDDIEINLGVIPSTNFPNSGMTILRRQWNGNTCAANFKWGMPENRGDFGLLSVGLFFYGYTCQSYPGHISWGNNDLFHHWQIQSASHSTITVDRHNQSDMKDYVKEHYMPHPSRQVFYTDGKDASATVAFNDRIYPGVKIWRAVCMLDGAYLILDALRSDEEHIYDRWFHGVPDNSNGLEGIHLNMKPRSNLLGDDYGYEMVENLSSAITEKDFSADWTIPESGNRKEITLSMRVLNDSPLEAVHGFEWSRQYKKPEKEFLLLSRKARSADFIALLEPHFGESQVSKYERFIVKDKNGMTVENALGLHLTLAGKACEIILNPDEENVKTVKGTTRKVLSIEVK